MNFLKKILIIIFIFLGIFPYCLEGDDDVSESEFPDVSIILQWYPQSQFAGFIIAKEKGFFKEMGLNVELQFFRDSGSTLDRLFDNQADFATAWLSQAIKYSAEGHELINIFQILKRSSLVLITKSEHGITVPEDLNGRCVSIWGGDFSVQPKAFFKKFGIEPRLAEQSYSIELFLSGACEVTSAMYYNEYNKIYQAGLDREDLITFFFSDYGLNFPEDGIYCTREFLEENSEIANKFIEGAVKGWKYAFEHPDEALDMVMGYSRNYNLRTNKAHQAWMLEHIKESFLHNVSEDISNWGELSEEDYNIVASVLLQQGLIENIPDFRDFFRDLKNER